MDRLGAARVSAPVDALLVSVLGWAEASDSISPGLAPDDLWMVNRMLVAASAAPGIDSDDALDKTLNIIMTGLKTA
jgi:hypothetical protein